MNIGLGLLLDLCRLNWATTRKYFLMTLGALTVLGLVSLGGILSYQYYQGLPKVMTEFQGLTLGESLSDATFKLGIPGEGFPPLPPDISPREELNFLRRLELENALEKIDASGGTKSVTFKSFSVTATLRNDKIERVSYSCALNQSDHTSLNGITCGEPGDDILKRFNGDVRVLCRIKAKQEGPWSKYEQLNRVYDVMKYGTRYHLSQNMVTNMEIAAPDTIQASMGSTWVKCQ